MTPNKIKGFSIAAFLVVLVGQMGYGFQDKVPVDYINPMIGAVTYGKQSKDAHGFGKTFPGRPHPLVWYS